MKTLTELAVTFPSLDRAASRVTSMETSNYNCIAYAAGDFGRWWWPDPYGIAYWPSGVVRVEALPAFQCAFEALGYVLCSDASLEDGIEKVAIYALNATPMHASRQLETGIWSSKLGKSEDISHNFDGLDGPHYGRVAFVMRRRRQTP